MMITKEKGYSLNVLIITIAVMLILMSTAIVSMQNLTKDRDITEFMNDLQEVEEFAKEYYATKNTLPIKENSLVSISEEIENQADPNDAGNYYMIDLEKIGSIKLYDNDRGYLLNESTLRVYVQKPIKYEGVEYYTLTDEILGLNKTYSGIDDFEVLITGNPITWVRSAKLGVSIPNKDNIEAKDWSLKYEKGKISAEQFKTMGKSFEYGQNIEITENGMYSFYVEHLVPNNAGEEEGYVKVVYVNVNRIDDINPYEYVEYKNGKNQIMITDDETGIEKVMFKIQNYDISPNTRAVNSKMIASYVQGTPTHLTQQSGEVVAWTYVEAYTGERVNGIEPSIGYQVDKYKTMYEEYLTQYSYYYTLSGDEGVKHLSEDYPMFQYTKDDGTVHQYGDDERNIVLYVEDYNGNRSVTDKTGENLCIVSRKILIDSNLVNTIIKPLNGARVVLTNKDGNSDYTNEDEVNLQVSAQGATKMFVTLDSAKIPTIDEYKDYEKDSEFNINPTNDANVEKEVTIYVFVTAEQTEDGNLKYERVEGKIYLDNKEPTNTAPVIDPIQNDLKITKFTFNQKDTGSGISKREFAYKLSTASNYSEWLTFNERNVENITLLPDSTYNFKTRATDVAGNVRESAVTDVVTPVQAYRTVPNAPQLATGMQPIAWTGTLARPENEKVMQLSSMTEDKNGATVGKSVSGDDLIWYNYVLETSDSDTKQNIWANAKTTDGNYWVWIPRFAYKIIYYTDSSKSIVKGYYQKAISSNENNYYSSDGTTIVSNPDSIRTKYFDIDVIFLAGTSDTSYIEKNLDTGASTMKQLSSEYIVHPAFSRIETSSVNNKLGNWSTNLEGIWVAKFESSRVDATDDESGTSTAGVKSIPSVRPWTNLKIDDAYEYAKNYNVALSSHLIKNSEWGATVYLAHSGYGRNGKEVLSNRSVDSSDGLGGLTGGGGSGTGTYSYTTGSFKGSYSYSTTSGMNASTTGNIYGVYDMAGGVKEYVASYLINNAGGKNDALDNGQKLQETDMPYFREAYQSATSDSEFNNYNRLGKTDNVYGNAIFETSLNGSGSSSANGDSSVYMTKAKPFLTRGGDATSGNESGVFNFENATGEADKLTGFRMIIITR